ncbi:MAG: PQQ-binding-like beta-propeller repeat protein, partial [Planctomycetota bacterium]
RLAVADGRLGDSKAAEKALSKLSLSDDPRVALVRKDVTAEGVSAGRIARHDAGDWLSKYGTSDRAATMPAVPENAFPNELSELWSYNFDLHVTPEPFNPNQAMGAAYTATGFYSSSLYAGNTRSTSKNSKNRIERRSLVDKWTQCGRTPVGGLLLFEGMVYFKSENRVVCCDADSGEMVWMGIENAFEVDPATRQQLLLSASMPVQTSGLRKPEELQLFADQIFQAMSIGEGNLYSVEGPSVLDPAPVQVQKTPNVYAYAMTVPTRSRQNWLAAYDARNGKLRWRRGAREVEVDGSKFDVGFSCAPVSGAGLTYVTVNETGSIWLLALNPTDGSTVYRTYLCDEPAGSCNPWATTGVAYAEGDVYVATGAGIVAAVDGVSGALRWVVRYERSGDVRKQPSPFGMQMSISKPTGWQDDVVVAAGRSVIVMGSDSDEIFALDRRTGEVLWDSPRNSNRDAEYYLGMSGSRLYVGADDLVRCYDSIGGRVIWEAEIEDSAGTGIATNEAIYVPTQSSIVKLSLAKGTELARSHFKTMTREPVGNLYSDGNRLFGVGAARTYAFADLQER